MIIDDTGRIMIDTNPGGGGTTEHASKQNYGIVKIGNNLNVNDGVISANPSSAPYPASFNTHSTTLAFCQSIAGTAEATVGMTYLGALYASDMPFSGNSEVIVRIMTDSKVIVLEMFSTNVACNHWYAMYAGGSMTTGDATCPWQGIMSINGNSNSGYTPVSDYQAASKKYVDSNIPDIRLGPCTGMGIVRGAGNNVLTWIDPDDVILNNSVLTYYVETRLVVKEGADPDSVTDGTVIANTNREAGTKNQYRTFGFNHNTTGFNIPHYKLFSLSSSGKWNDLTANLYPAVTTYSWGQIQAIVRAGTAASFFPVGTVLQVEHPEYTHTNSDGIYFMVLGHDQVQTQNQALEHTMCLGMTEGLFNSSFDFGEKQYALTADTVAITGKIYYVFSGGTYTALTEGTDWHPGDPVPAATWYEKNINDRQYGSNNWPWSNLRQWSNSTGPAGTWFTPQTIWDQVQTGTGSLSERNGFLKNIDPNFLAVVAKAEVRYAKANCDGGGYGVTYDKFWPLSQTQVFGGTGYEGDQLTYFSQGGEKRKTLMDQAAYTNWWLRSANAGGSGGVCYVATSGSSAGSFASGSYGVSLACIIA